MYKSPWNDVSFEDLKGKTLKSFNISDDKSQIEMRDSDGNEYTMLHVQDCCEAVWLEDVCGDIEDLIDHEILVAEETSNREDEPVGEYVESYTWTYYTLATIKGTLTLRWFGESNGYYSEDVDFRMAKPKEQL